MRKIIIAALLGSFVVCTSAAPAPSTEQAREFKQGYDCWMEGLKSGYGAGPAGYCVGNSRDPSKSEERGYAAAERDFNAAKLKQTATEGCAFGFAVWQGNGSHASDWLDGPQRVTTMRQTAERATHGWQPVVYDKNGNGVPADLVNRWFVVKKVKGDDQVILTPEALKTCSKKQIG
jgi:hypothetical protein